VRVLGTYRLWGRLVTRLPRLAERAVERRLPTGAQDAILPHTLAVLCTLVSKTCFANALLPCWLFGIFLSNCRIGWRRARQWRDRASQP